MAPINILRMSRVGILATVIGSFLFLFTAISNANGPVQIDFAPTCRDSAVTVQHNTPTPINFDCSDIQGALLRIQFVGGLEHGSITDYPNPAPYEQITPWGILSTTYTPDTGFAGEDTLTFRANKLVGYPCPDPPGIPCPAVMVDSNSYEATIKINVLPPGRPSDTAFKKNPAECAGDGLRKLKGKLKKSRKRNRALKRRYKRFQSLGRSGRSSKSRSKYRSKAKRIKAGYRKTKKRSNRLRNKIIACHRAGF